MGNQYWEQRARVSALKFKLFLILFPIILLLMLFMWIEDQKHPIPNRGTRTSTSFNAIEMMNRSENPYVVHVSRGASESGE